MAIDYKTIEEIAILREGGKRLGRVLEKISLMVQDGVTTYEVDQAARQFVAEEGGTPSFLGYHDFPAAICISLNHEIVHGLPSKNQFIRNGDLVGIDIGMWYKGFCNDTALTVTVGEVSKEARLLAETTQQSLYRAIEAVRIGGHTGDVGAAVEEFVKPTGFGIVRDLVGHGVGRAVHEEPPIPNVGTQGAGVEFKEGMVIALEPMINIGSDEVLLHSDGWTYCTVDGTLSAHYEHTLALTSEGVEILTLRPSETFSLS